MLKRFELLYLLIVSVHWELILIIRLVQYALISWCCWFMTIVIDLFYRKIKNLICCVVFKKCFLLNVKSTSTNSCLAANVYWLRMYLLASVLVYHNYRLITLIGLWHFLDFNIGVFVCNLHHIEFHKLKGIFCISAWCFQGGTVSAMTINKGILLGFVPSGDTEVKMR